MKQSPQSQAPDRDVTPEPEQLSPQEWAKRLGQVRFAWLPSERPTNEKAAIYTAAHASAVVLHGWAQHEHHEGKPIQLSEADYKAALLAAQAAHPVTKDERDAYRPHVAALSQHKGKRIHK